MGAGLYPAPTNPNVPRGIRHYTSLGSTAYVGDTETRAYLATWTAEAGRMYRITLNLAIVDADGVADVATVADHGAKNSATIRARWAYGTDATTASSDLGGFYQSVYDDDSQFASGASHDWFLGGASAGDIAVAITLKATKAAATYGSVRILTAGGNSTSLHVEDIGSYPVP
ncbi:hypothetical protein HUN43_00022 [Streptomyces phage Endor1]|uniref:DUF7298 domain-containing protein n=1 Tax=Streptomyces phage Endor1 TaxID=2740181 RepID=A0A7G4AWT5_9CAUD|nr:hypothetical protein KGG92_gp22 [Streptomyces phage Endor1]QMP84475.1 hypothetical protein HUN43_00022 [Streptomyces phage Endor1]